MTTARLFKLHSYSEPFALDPATQVTFLNAGHIPGSASILFETTTQEGPKSLLFSGDLGNNLARIFPGPQPAPQVDAVFVETTYGAKRRPSEVAKAAARFRRVVAETLNKGGIAWIPAFALDRTQKVLDQIQVAKDAGLIDQDVRVLCPSPTARKISGIYRDAAKSKSGWFYPDIEQAHDPFRPEGLTERDRPSADMEGPAIIITTSGMLDAAFSAGLLPKLVTRTNVTICLVGWQDPMSPGGILQKAPQTMRLNGEDVAINAKIEKFSCFSGHGDASDIDAWLTNNKTHQASVFLVHGDADFLKNRQSQLLQRGWSKVLIPEPRIPTLRFQ